MAYANANTTVPFLAAVSTWHMQSSLTLLADSAMQATELGCAQEAFVKDSIGRSSVFKLGREGCCASSAEAVDSSAEAIPMDSMAAVHLSAGAVDSSSAVCGGFIRRGGGFIDTGGRRSGGFRQERRIHRQPQ